MLIKLFPAKNFQGQNILDVRNGRHYGRAKNTVAQRIRFNESYGEQNLKLIENMDTQVLKDQKDRKSTTNHTLKRQKSPKTILKKRKANSLATGSWSKVRLISRAIPGVRSQIISGGREIISK